MTVDIDFRSRTAKEQGWSGEALLTLSIDPRGDTPDGFSKMLKEANDIRHLIKIVAPHMQACGYETDTAAEFFVAKGHSLDEIRADTIKVMAEHDEATSINTTRRGDALITSANIYAQRQAQLDEIKAKRSGKHDAKD